MRFFFPLSSSILLPLILLHPVLILSSSLLFQITPFKNAHQNRDKDDELLRLAEYLELIAEHESDFSKLDHRRWGKYVRNRSRRR